MGDWDRKDLVPNGWAVDSAILLRLVISFLETGMAEEDQVYPTIVGILPAFVV